MREHREFYVPDAEDDGVGKEGPRGEGRGGGSEAFVRGAGFLWAEAHDGAGEGDVVGGGDFDVAGVAGDDDDALAEAFDELGVVGAGQVGLLVGGDEDLACKDLWRLHADEVRAVDCFLHGTQGRGVAYAEDRVEGVGGGLLDGLGVDAFECVGNVDPRDHRGVVLGGIEDAIDEVGGCARAGGVVHGDVCAVSRGVREGGGDGFVAVRCPATGDDNAQEGEFVGVAEFEVGEGGFIVRAGDDDARCARVVGEELDGALQDGAPAEVLVELGGNRAWVAPLGDGRVGVTLARAGGGDDDANGHACRIVGAAWPGLCPQQEAIDKGVGVPDVALQRDGATCLAHALPKGGVVGEGGDVLGELLV